MEIINKLVAKVMSSKKIIAITATTIITDFCLLALAHVTTLFIWSIVSP